MRRFLSTAFLLAAAILSGCQQKGGVDSRFVEAFVELRMVETTYGSESPTARMARVNVLKQFGYTREQFLAEADKLLEDDSRWVDFQKAVIARIDTLAANPSAGGPAPKPVPQPSVPSHKGGVQ